VISRRRFLQGAAAFIASGAALAGYAFGFEPYYRLALTRYRVKPRGWPDGMPLRLAVIADLHAGAPVMPLSRVREIVAATNALQPDITLLLGDYETSERFATRHYRPEDVFAILKDLSAPLGVHACLGNHDYWGNRLPKTGENGAIGAPIRIDDWRRAIPASGITLLENDAIRIVLPKGPFWLAATASIVAIPLGRGRYRGLDKLPETLAIVNDDAPVILMAHEPDLFVDVPSRVSLTLSGHTHGGQVRLFGRSLIVPSEFGNRFAYGHVIENDRHLIVSGGLGTSILPVRLGVPPEIVLIEIPA
jgi:uncharacterized protein